jgi:hypothetical protein
LTDLLAPLEADQTILLQVISEPYIKHERWPTFAYVSGELRRRGLDARELLRSMPRTQAAYGVMGSGYGLVKSEQFFQADSDVWLTVAGQFHVPALTSRCRSFVIAIQDLRRFLAAQPSSPFELKPVYVRGVNMSDGSVGKFSPPFARVLLGMLIHEPVTFHNGFEGPRDGSDWKLSLNQTLLEFDDVRTIEDYVGRVVELTGGNASWQDVDTVKIAPLVV